MRGMILHESIGRIRVRLNRRHMTMDEADVLEEYLSAIDGVLSVRVSERTSDVIVRYQVSAEAGGRTGETLNPVRESVLRAISDFSFESCGVSPPEHTGRALQHEYVNRLAFHILRRAASRILLPLPMRTVITGVKTVPYLWRGLKSLAHGRIEVSVLDAASILVCLLRGEADTAGSVMFLLGISDMMEEWTHKKSVDDLAGIMSLGIDKVWLKAADGTEVLAPIGEVHAGDLVIVRTGNMIPVDGDVVEGDAMVNQASMTGEPLAVHKTVGAWLYAGSVVEEGELVLTVRQESGESRYDRIVKIIEDSEKLKSAAEAKAARLADRLVPWTFAATGLTWIVTQNTARAASILMVDFCCALKLSMPIAVLSAMREAGKLHISVKGGKFLENFAEADTFVFDKTGTLTNAEPRVHAIVPFAGREEQEMLRLAACLEEHYPHSMANAVVREAAARGLVHEERHSRVEYVVAHGIASSIDGEEVRIGSHHFIFEDEGCRVPVGEEEKLRALPDQYSHLYLAIGGELAAVLLIEDPLKAEVGKALEELHALGVRKLVMLTGDNEWTARAIAEQIGIDEYQAEVLPEEKAAFIRTEHAAGRKVVMIGDGINDTPALSEADVGVAINSGAAIAREIADITISEDDLNALVTLRRLSASLMRRIDYNYRTIVTFNSFLVLMGAIGLFPASLTALLHNTSTVLISVNSMTDLLDG